MGHHDRMSSANGLATPVISLRSVTKTYVCKGAPPVTAVEGVSLDIHRGEFVMITGRSGSGKTTLLNLAAGLTAPTSGSVTVEGQDLWACSDRDLSRLRNEKLGFVFQFPSLVPNLSAVENVMLPATLWSGRGDGDSSEARALELLELVGLSDKARAWPRTLSAGQQQRVVLARALVKHPSIILADEPSSNLDEATELEIMGIFRDVHEATGVTVCMVTHTSQLVSWGTRAVCMAAGAVIEDTGSVPGSPEEPAAKGAATASSPS